MGLSADYDSVNILHMHCACLCLYQITGKLSFSIHSNLALAGYQTCMYALVDPGLGQGALAEICPQFDIAN